MGYWRSNTPTRNFMTRIAPWLLRQTRLPIVQTSMVNVTNLLSCCNKPPWLLWQTPWLLWQLSVVIKKTSLVFVENLLDYYGKRHCLQRLPHTQAVQLF